MCVYQTAIANVLKDDDAFSTAALRSRHRLLAELAKLTPEIPALSAQDDAPAGGEQYNLNRYWLLDPLAGSEAFTKRSGEFTTNIALIEDGVPVLGVVHAPALETTYWGARAHGSAKVAAGQGAQPLSVAAPPERGQAWRVVAGRSQAGLAEFMARLPDAQLLDMAGPLSLCLVAEGAADLSPHLRPTDIRTTAAAHAILSAAGGKLLTWPGLQPLVYQRPGDPLPSPSFIACATAHADWLPTADPVYERREHDSCSDVVWHCARVCQSMRAQQLGQRPCCIWLTGLSGSGKSTIANALELVLHEEGRHTFLLDGDNIRHGLNRDLGMSDEDRAENIRRVGEVAKLMVDAGLVVVTAFISPFREDREQVRRLFAPEQFIEVFVDTPLSVCEQRDPKGLYRKVRAGKIQNFTGIDSPYEAPELPDIVLRTAQMDVPQCVSQLRALLARR